MPIVHLVRHGQASFGSPDYDNLSELGRQQARWLGEYFAERGVCFARAACGALRRQRDTTTLILESLPDCAASDPDDCLNEYRAADVLRAHARALGDAQDPTRKDDVPAYFRRLREALTAWSSQSGLPGTVETWTQFGERIDRAMVAALADLPRDAQVLVVTSGGVIARAVSNAMGASSQVAVELNLQVRNTSITELLVGRRGTRLMSFNGVPHLERADRRHAMTYT